MKLVENVTINRNDMMFTVCRNFNMEYRLCVDFI